MNKKESWLNSVHFLKHTTKCQKNTSFVVFFLQNEKKYKRQKKREEHTCRVFFLSPIEKVKAHTPTFILFVKLCKKPISFFFLKKKRDDINSVPPVRKLVIKKNKQKNSTMTHSLHSFKSPDVILSATRRQKTQKKKEGKNKKAPAPTTTQIKKKQSKQPVGAVFTPHTWNGEPCRKNPASKLKTWRLNKRRRRHGQVGAQRRKTTPNKPQGKKGCRKKKKRTIFQEEEENQGTAWTPRPVGPKNAPGAKRDGDADTDTGEGDVQNET